MSFKVLFSGLLAVSVLQISYGYAAEPGLQGARKAKLYIEHSCPAAGNAS